MSLKVTQSKLSGFEIVLLSFKTRIDMEETLHLLDILKHESAEVGLERWLSG